MGNVNLQGGSGRFGMLVADEEAPEGFDVEPEGEGLYDPGAHNVEEVNEYLDSVDSEEYSRVIEAETAGKARVGIIGS